MGNDVCDILSITHVGNAYKRLDETEISKVRRTDIGMRQGKPAVVVTESGLYKLVLRSDKPQAKEFQDHVAKVILPAIRKDGAYIEGEEKVKTGEMSDDEFVLKAMNILQAKVARLTEERDAARATINEHLEHVIVDEWRALASCRLKHPF